MYTNALLREKEKAQRSLAERAAKECKSYEDVVEEEVTALFHTLGRRLVYSRRKGKRPPAQTASTKSK